MKTKSVKLIAFLLPVLLTVSCKSQRPQAPSNNKVQVALLLDASNSMDGLIDQAKAQLWKMVNELSLAKRNGEAPEIELAFYEYGKSSLEQSDGYIRQIVPFSQDLDLISEKLFQLTTNGGDEYCGEVIDKSMNDLDWDSDNEVLKIIFIAGNEAFTQGNTNYIEACKKAIKNGVIVNTIFCGSYDEGVRTQWQHGAELADGNYINIDQNQQIAQMKTPYDSLILDYNTQLNTTYIGYGAQGYSKKQSQAANDAASNENYGSANLVERAVSKSGTNYITSSWDLVAAAEDEAFEVDKLDQNDLPEEMKNMSDDEKENYIDAKAKERKAIQNEINRLNAKRQEYIVKQQKELASENVNSLDMAIKKMIRTQSKNKGYQFN